MTVYAERIFRILFLMVCFLLLVFPLLIPVQTSPGQIEQPRSVGTLEKLEFVFAANDDDGVGYAYATFWTDFNPTKNLVTGELINGDIFEGVWKLIIPPLEQPGLLYIEVGFVDVNEEASIPIVFDPITIYETQTQPSSEPLIQFTVIGAVLITVGLVVYTNRDKFKRKKWKPVEKARVRKK
ncbi:MAG: hypothetical protein ACXAEU_08305 [Candidatus Hodarchaeales archaeon]|jgi:hypothetical protein